MPGTLVDSSVLLDISTNDPVWFDWSSGALAAAVRGGPVLVNPIIYAEVSVGYDRIEDRPRITYGVDWQLTLPNWRISTTVGQSYRLDNRSSILSASSYRPTTK